MNFLLKAVIFCCLAASVLSAAVPSRHYPEGTYQPSVQGWKKTNKPVSPHRLVQLQILLKRRNLDKLEERFWAVSDPTNPDYGKYMTLEQIADLIAPTEKEINVVQEWLSSFNVKHSLLKSRDWIVAEATVAQVEALFGVKYSLYIHKSGRRASATVDSYSVPMELKDLIEEVSGIFGLPTMKKSGPRIGMGGVGPMAITPVQIRARYNVTSDLIVTNKTNLHACSEFQGQYYSPSDLQQFFSQYVTTPNVVDTVDKVIGFNNPQQPQLEGSLDVQYLMGVAPNATTWFYTMKAFNFYSDLKTWLGWLNNETVIPSVMTVSYGSQGDYPSTSYQQSSDVEYQKLGLRGLSVIYASGDSGAGCSGNQRLAPSYPAISVYVTSVGATRFIKGNSGEEAAVQAFGSGGGFAWTTPMPSYQQTAVQAYLSSGVTLPPAAKFNASNRATPDVAALGAEHFLVINGGGVTPVGGTSASAPTFGAIITLLNDIRLNNNKPTLGFLNTWLYQTAAADATAFFDVTVGNNFSGCFQQGQSGYQCAPGWDPVTGLGTPNFEVLQNYV